MPSALTAAAAAAAASIALLVTPTAAQNGGPGIVPRWPQSWAMNQSTAFMPCNTSGFVDADFAAKVSPAHAHVEFPLGVRWVCPRAGGVRALVVPARWTHSCGGVDGAENVAITDEALLACVPPSRWRPTGVPAVRSRARTRHAAPARAPPPRAPLAAVGDRRL